MVGPAARGADANRMPSARLHAGHVVAGLGALLAITALWMPWYALASSERTGAGTTVNAWTAFGGTDALLAGAAALVLVATVAAAGDRVDTEAAARGIVMVGGVAMLLVLAKLVAQPGPNALAEVRHGPWAATAGCVLMVAGGAAARRPASVLRAADAQARVGHAR
jgi:hypothetical protein